MTNATTAENSVVPSIEAPPRGFWAVSQHLGPGLIISASIVGSGELIMTTTLGAEVGFVLLWFIILGCVIKVFIQIELGRYAIAHGRTTLEALDSLPGPRFFIGCDWSCFNASIGAGWLIYIWLAMYVATFFQLAGIVGTIAGVFRLGGQHATSLEAVPSWLALTQWSDGVWAALITLSCAVLLAVGRYRLVERTSTIMVAFFTLFTIAAVGALYRTDYAIRWDDVKSGLTFGIPENFTIAFAAFGIIGVGASELIYYPYWCLEKGYARAVGPNDGSADWGVRARGWMRVLRADAWVSMVVYTGATVAFYLLGAAVLHGKSIRVTDQELVTSLSKMYSESFGQMGLWFFLIGAFIVLYSTVFIATASNARLMVDVIGLLGIARPRDAEQRAWWVKYASIALPAIYLAMFLIVGEPLGLVVIGGIAQAMMLPPLSFAALYFHHYRLDRQLRTSLIWTALLWLSSILVAAAGVYQIDQKLQLHTWLLDAVRFVAVPFER